jgi:hypothetical protein
LTFTAETSTGLGSSADPDVVKLSNGTLRMYYNNGNGTGGTIFSAISPARAAVVASPMTMRPSNLPTPPTILKTPIGRGGIVR